MTSPLAAFPDDGLYTPTIRIHSLQKLRRHQLYAEVFAKSMSSKWKQRAYVGLYCGAGRARVEETGAIVETAPLAVLRLSPGFTHHIFVDRNPDCTRALSQRIEALGRKGDAIVLEGDVNSLAGEVRRALPKYSKGNGLLSFCFVDPFAADVHFDTIRALSGLRMDFLILLMLGVDARRNFRQYRDDPSSTRIGDLVDCPDWRHDFGDRPARCLIPYLLHKFDEAMVRLGYCTAPESEAHRVTIHGKNVLQYVLVFYSKHPLGRKFWQDCLAAADVQGSLGI